MDLGGESSVLESVEDNGATTPIRSSSVDDGTKVENNGSLGVEHGGDFSASGGDTIKSPAGTSTPAMKKGYGLKKWRRIRRDVVRDGSSNSDSEKILKRGFSTPSANSRKPQGSPVQRSNKSETSLSSTNAIVQSAGNFSLDSESGAGFSFAAVVQSENSEDHSSKSSTAASFPKMSRDILAEVGKQDKNQMSTSSVNNLTNSRKGRGDSGKKHRGERVKIEKENSHSSMESDLRSSNFVFMQGDNSAASNGRRSGRSVKSDGESSIDAHGGEQRFDEELQDLYGKPGVGKFEDLYQEDSSAGVSWTVKEENHVNHSISSDEDPLVKSIQTLQVVEEELQKELQKFKDIGTDPVSVFDNSTTGGPDASIDSIIHSPNSTEQFTFGTHSGTGVSEMEMDSLKKKISLLESKLEEANTTIKTKDAKLVELENYRELEAELENMCKQKIEAEVECLVMTKTIQTSKLASANQVSFMEEQKTLVLDQARVLRNLGDAEKKAALLKKEAEKLETVCGDIADASQVVKLQKKAWKVTSYLFLQLILFFVVFAGILSQLSSRYAEVVPT